MNSITAFEHNLLSHPSIVSSLKSLAWMKRFDSKSANVAYAFHALTIYTTSSSATT